MGTIRVKQHKWRVSYRERGGKRTHHTIVTAATAKRARGLMGSGVVVTTVKKMH